MWNWNSGQKETSSDEAASDVPLASLSTPIISLGQDFCDTILIGWAKCVLKTTGHGIVENWNWSNDGKLKKPEWQIVQVVLNDTPQMDMRESRKIGISHQGGMLSRDYDTP